MLIRGLGVGAAVCVSGAAWGSWFYAADEVGIAAEVVGVNLVPPSEVGVNRTIRVWAVMPDGWRLDAIAGNSSQPLSFSTNGVFFQHELGGATSQSIASGFFPMVPSLEWDTFLTIGALDMSGGGTPSGQNELGEIGFDWSSFEAGGSLSADNGGCWVLPTDGQGDAIGFVDGCERQGQGVLIGQFTLLGETAVLNGSILLQGSDASGETWQRPVTSFEIDEDGVSDALPQVACAADMDSSGEVDVDDLLSLLAAWAVGACADISGDAVMDQDDFLFLIGAWGPCDPE